MPLKTRGRPEMCGKDEGTDSGMGRIDSGVMPRECRRSSSETKAAHSIVAAGGSEPYALIDVPDPKAPLPAWERAASVGLIAAGRIDCPGPQFQLTTPAGKQPAQGSVVSRLATGKNRKDGARGLGGDFEGKLPTGRLKFIDSHISKSRCGPPAAQGWAVRSQDPKPKPGAPWFQHFSRPGICANRINNKKGKASRLCVLRGPTP
jgi:hypothetical protein